MVKILIADDEMPQRKMISSYMEKMGFLTLEAADGEEVLRSLESDKPDLLLLDIMLPKMDGFSILKSMLVKNPVPTIIISARVEESDKVLGLELGAEDYITKPFSLRELVARIQVVLRRTNRSSPTSEENVNKWIWHDLILDISAYKVYRAEEILPLTTVQFEILKLLASHPGQVFSRSKILEEVQNTNLESYERTIDVHIKNLRKILGENPRLPRYVETVRGVGYLALPDKR